jgi:hypothetical protein
MNNGQSASKQPQKVEGSTTILCCGEVLFNVKLVNWEKVDNNLIYIYLLVDPISKEVRYIGLTKNLKKRFYAHITNTDKLSHKRNWIKSLKIMNLKPFLYIIKTFDLKDFEKADKYETFLIRLFAKYDYKLTNHDKIFTQNNNYSLNCKHKNTKKVYYFDNEFNLMGEFNSLKEVCLYFKRAYSTVSLAIKNKTKVSDYYLSFENNFNKEFKNRGKKCYQYDLNGNYINEFISVAEAFRLTGINRNSIKDNINGKQKSAEKFIFTDYKKDKIDKYTSLSNRYKKLLKI